MVRLALYYDNAKKFETSSTGVSVTGGVVASGGLSIDSYADPSNNYITDYVLALHLQHLVGLDLPQGTTTAQTIDWFWVSFMDTMELASPRAALERARLDSSGNLLLGKTALGTANDGLQAKPAGELVVTRDGNHSLILNRKSSDGDIALLQKGGT